MKTVDYVKLLTCLIFVMICKHPSILICKEGQHLHQVVARYKHLSTVAKGRLMITAEKDRWSRQPSYFMFFLQNWLLKKYF